MIVKYYLPIRLDVVAKTVLKALILKTDPTDKFKHQQDPEYVYKVIDCEFWWNLSIKTATKLMYPHYKFQIVPIVIAALGCVPKCLEMYIHQLGINKIETEKLVRKLQNLSASGTVKICKTFLSFKDS